MMTEENSRQREIQNVKDVGVQMQILGEQFKKKQRLMLAKELYHMKILTVNTLR